MQAFNLVSSSETPGPLDVDGLVVRAHSHATLRRNARREALLRGEPAPAELRRVESRCPVCDEPMDALRDQPGVDDLELEELVGEGPFDLLVCRHRHEHWHALAQVLVLRLRHACTGMPESLKWQLAKQVQTLVNTSLGRPSEVETQRTCKLCQTPLVRTEHCFGTRMGTTFWTAFERCPKFNARENHTYLRR